MYSSVADLKVFVGIPALDVADDDILEAALEAASAQIDAFCDRTFTADGSVTVREYRVEDLHRLDVDPISTTTGLVVETDNDADGAYETTWTIGTDFAVEPINAADNGEPWTRLVTIGSRWFPKLAYRPGVRVTAKFGWPGGTAPAAVDYAALIQASRLFKRKDSPFGVAGSVEFGSEMRLLAKLDPDVESLLRRYRRNWWVA